GECDRPRLHDHRHEPGADRQSELRRVGQKPHAIETMGQTRRADRRRGLPRLAGERLRQRPDHLCRRRHDRHSVSRRPANITRLRTRSMKIAFHGSNAANFRAGLEALLDDRHTIIDLSDALDQPGERARFETADVIIGVKLGAAEPHPQAARLYHAPAAGVDTIDRSRLPATAALCNSPGHEDAIAEYVMTALLLRHVPLPRADARLREGHWDYWAGRADALRTELGGSTIGLLGFGHIGKAVAARAKAFGARIAVCNRTAVPVGGGAEASFGRDRLADFMGRVDAVVV